MLGKAGFIRLRGPPVCSLALSSTTRQPGNSYVDYAIHAKNSGSPGATGGMYWKAPQGER